jgi:uncharacterized protein
MPNKSFSFECKKVTDQGQFEGLAATYHNEDQVNDVILPGAFDVTLATQGKERTLLYNHEETIGVVSLTDSPVGLKASGQINLDVQRGREVFSLLKQKAIRGLSIGYKSMKDDTRAGVRYLQQIKLFEISLTAFPANEMATVTSVKMFQQQEEKKIKAALDDLQHEIANLRW